MLTVADPFIFYIYSLLNDAFSSLDSSGMSSRQNGKNVEGIGHSLYYAVICPEEMKKTSKTSSQADKFCSITLPDALMKLHHEENRLCAEEFKNKNLSTLFFIRGSSRTKTQHF